MTHRLPSTDQFLRAKNYLSYSGERALLAYYARTENLADIFKRDCILELKKAVKELGYELVEVVSTTAKDSDGNHIESTIPVTPEAPGGGRMEMPEVTGVAAVADA